MQARKQVEEMKTKIESEEVEASAEVETTEDLPKLDEFNDQEVHAITKIQSGFRGMKARQEVNEMKNASTSHEVSSPVTSGPDDEVPELLDTARPMTAQTNAEHVEIP